MTRVKLLVLTIALITTCSGCGYLQKQIVLHPIDKEDFMPMNKGVAYTPDRDGYFLSDYSLKEIENAKVSQAKKAA